jgi:hypothetical protein
MATLLLSAAGAAFGAGFGGTILGLSGAVIGRAVGATIGQAIDRKIFDQRIMGAGSEAVDQGRIDRLRVMGASEGAAIARVWGRQRLAGQVIWATRFLETVASTTTGGGKGGGAPTQTLNSYRYSISLAVALCEGEVLRLGRIWADGNEISPLSLNLRFYNGSDSQQPDPKIEAVEGEAPAYRGIAYVVIEDLALEPFGNRVPQLSFEVIRPAKDYDTDLSRIIPGVALIPGTGEYALATTPVHYDYGPADRRSANQNTASGQTDFATSLEDLTQELPSAQSVALVVSWFGDDLRCGACTVRPKVEQTQFDGAGMPWSVSGLTRAHAVQIAKIDGRPVYGGTPTDQSVLEAMRALKAAGKSVTFYPFILMDQLAGNGLPDPYGGAEQAALPWRGRISAADGTPATTAEVEAFFGTATRAQFSYDTDGVTYSGPDQWRYRRFILHYAHLCAAAGGVDSFLIGSEMRGLTQLRGGNQSFPTVTRLRALAADVRAILGPNCKISYAADWSEYFGYHADGNVYFHLDPLWADANIDYIGIDNYMPLSDWRDGDHLDQDFGSIHNLDYLRANIAGGEGFDWYYASPEGEAAQLRQPIVDGDWGEDWIYRYKDLRGWWQNFHYPRMGGVRAAAPTAWQPASKPFRFTEYGVAAIDKGANQPNRFLDPKSSESGLPKYSNGRRDDLMQMAYLRAMYLHWNDPEQNPQSSVYNGAMLDFANSNVWAWDARPFPDFPRNAALWSDGANYAAGHWLNGRSANQPLAAVLAEICTSGDRPEFSQCHGLVRGYAVQEITTARAMMQPLLLAHAQEVVEKDGRLHVQGRNAGAITHLEIGELVRSDEGALQTIRAGALEQTGRLRLGYIEAEGSYGARIAEAIFPDQGHLTLSQTEVPLVLQAAEAGEIAQRWMAEARLSRDTARFALPKSRLDLGAGDRVQIDGNVYRIDRSLQGSYQLIDAVRSEAAVYSPVLVAEIPRPWAGPLADVPVTLRFLDLPLLRGDEVAHAPYVCAMAKPWTGPVGVWSSVTDDNYTLNTVLNLCATYGVTQTALIGAPAGLWQRGKPLRVKLATGTLSSASAIEVLSGANLAAIGSGSDWEVIQFADAVLIEPDTYEIRQILRGQAGSLTPDLWPIGSEFLLLNAALQQINLPLSARGLTRNYRVGRAGGAMVQEARSFAGLGLRPYRVAHLRASPLGNDHLITWIRRSRIDGDTWDGIEVPLSETTEAYSVRVMSGATILREIVTNSPNFIYTAVMRAADGAGVSLHVAQRSDAFGNGPFCAISL